MSLDLARIRAEFPALASGAVYFDNPGGTQIAQQSLQRVTAYLTEANANRGGAFATSQASGELIEASRRALAEFINAARPQEIVFGSNMTTLTLAFSRSFARRLNPGDEIIVTHLDHDANIAPWLHVAEARGATVRWVDFDVEDGSLRLDQLEAALSGRTRLVAVGYASNALGTINPIHRIAELAHDAGALCFVDAVHFAPHGPIDVQHLGCDLLVLSTYKFFGPHLGALYGRHELLDDLFAYRIRPAPAQPPGKFETGTQNHEGIAGALGALEYLDWLGETFAPEDAERHTDRFAGRRLRFKQAMSAVRAYEMELSRALLEALAGIPGLRIYGQTDLRQVDRRVPTVAFRLGGYSPREVTTALAAEGIYAWDGNYYALAVTERLGVESQGGMVRVGLVHYNTHEEIERLRTALERLSAG